MRSNKMSRIFVIFLILVLLFIDFATSYICICYQFIPPKVNIIFRIVIAVFLSLFAITSNLFGREIRELDHNFYIAQVQDVNDDSYFKFVYYCSTSLRIFLAIWNYFSTFLVISLLLSGLNVFEIQGVWKIIIWAFSQIVVNPLIAFFIILCTIIVSYGPKMIIKKVFLKGIVGIKILDEEEFLKMSKDSVLH